MRCNRVVIMAALFITACKTTNPQGPEAQVPVSPLAAKPAPLAAPVSPSSALQKTPHLVSPGEYEVLIQRAPTARCPSNFELDEIDQAVRILGQDTINLVQEDLANIRKIMTRNDRDGINSCCNQLEQLVQDTEIMNEDKPSAVPSLEKIRKTTLQLCPPANPSLSEPED